jgi:pimeloyl-ACP methyl ester carboxylesterase
MKTESFSFDHGGAQLVGERAGTGESLIFLHAGVADKRMWRPQLIEFGASHHVVAYDRRGYGETSSVDEPFSHVDDLRALLDHLGIAKSTLIGSSQGGRIAIDFALTFPQRVNALALLAPAVSGAPGPGPLSAEIEALSNALDEAEEADDLDTVNALEAHCWLDGPTSPVGRIQGGLRELFIDMNGIALRKPELHQEIEPATAYDRLPNLSMPTLVLWGDLDFPYVRERCRYVVGSVPSASGIEIPATAHLPNLEQSPLVNGLLRNLLD